MANPTGKDRASLTSGTEEPDEYIFVKSYRNRSGKLMVAAHYGYAAWRFRIRKHKKKSK